MHSKLVIFLILLKTCLSFHIFNKTDSINTLTNQFCEKWNVKFSEGKPITIPGTCAQATCINAASNDVFILNCLMLQISKGCFFLKEDLTKNFPECCSSFICPRD